MKILVISVRGLHVGYLGCYGNDWIETPTLDSLASEGVVFDQHIADCPDPEKARRSWRSGRYQLPPLDGRPMPAAMDAPDLLDILRRAGIPTHLVIDGSRGTLDEFQSGWDEVIVVTPPRATDPLETALSSAVQVLDGLFAKEHWLVWVDLATLVPPWTVPEEYVSPYFEADAITDEEEDDEAHERRREPREPLFAPQPGIIAADDDETIDRLQYSFASAVTFLDAGLNALIEELGNLGLGDEIVFMLTSDHGMPLGEHGLVGLHRPWMHDELIHVPLLLSLPDGKSDVGRRIGALTQACDLMPTILELFGLPIPPVVHGRSLLPLARGAAGAIRPYACAGLEQNGGLEYVLRTPEWSLAMPVRVADGDPPRAPQLFVKPEDRWEVNNLLQHHAEYAEALEHTLRDFVAAAGQPGPLQQPPLPVEETVTIGPSKEQPS